MRSLSFALVAALALPVSALAVTYEPDATPEREAFENIEVDQNGSSTTDPTDDMVIFDAQMRNTMPPVLADLVRFELEHTAQGWLATFETAAPLPEDPGMPVNFFVYMDSDGIDSNNAVNDVFRTGTDSAVLLLFGTRTKWHAEWWKYLPATKEWQKQVIMPSFTAEGSVYTMLIPFSIMRENSPGEARAFALTSNNAGIISIDIAPGNGLPDVLEDGATPTTPGASDGKSGGGAAVAVVIAAAVIMTLVLNKKKLKKLWR
jgi:hypothetical protein